MDRHLFMKIILLANYIFISIVSIAQPAKIEKANPESLKTNEIELRVKKLANHSIKFPFRSIKIIDSRFDTTKIGFNTNLSFFNGSTRTYEKVIIKGGLQNSLEKYYNEYYKNSFTDTSISLLIVIKKFWLLSETEISAGTSSYSKSVFNFPVLRFEYYLSSDQQNYLPLKRIDTTFKNDIEYAYEFKNKISSQFFILNYALSAMVELIDYDKYLPLLASARKKDIKEIENYYQTAFNLPILNDSNYKAGIYLSFQEFLNNSPSINIDNLNSAENYWGYCDGKNIFSYYHNKKIFRCGDTFEYFADKIQSFGTKFFSEGAGAEPRIKALSMPVQLDMQTGKPYQ